MYGQEYPFILSPVDPHEVLRKHFSLCYSPLSSLEPVTQTEVGSSVF